MTFDFEGFETSSSTSTFVVYALAMYQEIQEKLRNEINRVLAKHDNKITYEAMQEMTYLQMVIDGEQNAIKCSVKIWSNLNIKM